MHEITLVFPDQLFASHPAIASGRPIYLAEEFLFYKVQPFHKQRLVILRSAMRAYGESLLKRGNEVITIPSNVLNQRGDLFALLKKKGMQTLHIAEFSDEWLMQDLTEAAEQYGWRLRFYPSPAFMCSEGEVESFFSHKEHYSMAQFYAHQRKRLGILMEGSSPVGGKFSFDTENRKKIPKGFPIPPFFKPKKNERTECVIDEIEAEFPEALGSARPFLYPTTHEEAHRVLQDFLRYKLALFGDYQDAVQMDESVLFHSVLSPALNIGLLTPREVVHETLEYAKNHSVPMNSLEGFLRQIIGWREFVRAAYATKGSFQRSFNFFNHKHPIPEKFWKGKTGILPIDTSVRRALQTGYCHHIERLMILGNFLLLTETSPHEVYKWFMACFVDAYDWVMVPNVYGMGQYADGGMIVTKPYIGGSNYILKMSDYPKGEWTEIWDGLFWRFIHFHEPLFQANYRMGVLVKMLDKNREAVFSKIRKAEAWLIDYREGRCTQN